jgi:WD40 repeat protein
MPLTTNCLEILDEPPTEADLTGRALLPFYNFPGQRNSPVWFDFKTGEILPFPLPDGYVSGGYDVSPDRKHLSYYLIREGDDLRYIERRFVVQTVDGRILANRAVDLEVWNIYYWLNNERIILGTWDIPYVIDPFTGQDHTPDWYSQSPGGVLLSRSLWESKVVLDPNLTRAFYIQDDTNLILWDLEQEKLLATINEQLHIPFDMPQWTTDGEQVLFDYAVSQDENQQEELFSLSRDGELRRLTYLSDYYARMGISEFSISPDNQQVAFFFRDFSESQPADQFTVLDLATLEVTNFCNLTGKTRGFGAIIWAPDGQRLLILRTDGDKKWETILIDLTGGYAWKVIENYVPSAWVDDYE